MDDDRAPLSLAFAALAAVVLALSVFAPWYRVSITTAGVATTQQELATVAKQYGNPAFQAEVSRIGVRFSSLAGREVATVSARQALKHESLILLALAGVALLAALLRLANQRGLLFATGSQIALFGGLAFLDAFYRLIFRPAGMGLVAFSPSWGLWLALVSAIAIVGGGLLAGSDRVAARHARPGPGPPPLKAPPSIREIAQGSPLHPPTRRR